ncbi:MAG: hypothetical protein JKX89_09435 [Idiomarina sp.]|nr:hypothetical protein [Idiomarina sp.]
MSDLKSQNESSLSTFLLISLIPAYLSILTYQWDYIVSLAQSQPFVALGQLAAVGLGPIVCLKFFLHSIVNILNNSFKERLVHLKWHDPLPAGYADKLIHKDPRLHTDHLPEIVRPLLASDMSPKERNSYWYQYIYKPVRHLSAVSNTHKRYLLYRDATAGVFVVTIIVFLSDIICRMAWALPIISPLAYVVSSIYLLLLLGSAKNAGERMVTGAIANFNN